MIFSTYKIIRRVFRKKRSAQKISKANSKAARADYLALKESARELVHARLEHFNAHYGLAYGRVAIKNQRTKWGSCSSRGNLNFSYRIVKLPPDLQDYLIVHELCHLAEMNHGPRFWALVAEMVPDYKADHRRLRHFNT